MTQDQTKIIEYLDLAWEIIDTHWNNRILKGENRSSNYPLVIEVAKMLQQEKRGV